MISIQTTDLKQGPPAANTHYLLGTCYERIKDHKKCQQHMKSCLSIDKNHFNACLLLA